MESAGRTGPRPAWSGRKLSNHAVEAESRVPSSETPSRALPHLAEPHRATLIRTPGSVALALYPKAHVREGALSALHYMPKTACQLAGLAPASQATVPIVETRHLHQVAGFTVPIKSLSTQSTPRSPTLTSHPCNRRALHRRQALCLNARVAHCMRPIGHALDYREASNAKRHLCGDGDPQSLNSRLCKRFAKSRTANRAPSPGLTTFSFLHRDSVEQHAFEEIGLRYTSMHGKLAR